METKTDKKLSYRSEAARCFVSLNVLLCHSRSLNWNFFRNLGYGFLFATNGGIFSRFDTIHERDRQTDVARRHGLRLRVASRGRI